MEEIKCPRCGRKAKIIECVCSDKGRKRMMLHFPCYHFAALSYNVPCSTDNNTITKDFKSISKEYFDKTYYFSNYGDRYIDL